MLYNLLAVACGGAIGASLRYLVSVGFAYTLAVNNPFAPFPVSTLVINLVGCFLMGFLATMFSQMGPETATWRSFATVGLLGGFTTLSTFGLETLQLFDQNATGVAIINIALTFIACFAGIILGRMLANAVFPARL